MDDAVAHKAQYLASLAVERPPVLGETIYVHWVDLPSGRGTISKIEALVPLDVSWMWDEPPGTTMLPAGWQVWVELEGAQSKQPPKIVSVIERFSERMRKEDRNQ